MIFFLTAKYLQAHKGISGRQGMLELSSSQSATGFTGWQFRKDRKVLTGTPGPA